ncbi:hypothetical protein PITCH_A2030090 [uncultured Desulfobacterium sp.]|uniref:Uncharacterized protein n=1 Tax=uncultured Desulfobacterium sp. TaxID=201089 RepID=A0A445MWS3_9BACT|nr:hypothetical protein PITCH_A2030090 [uncultured Desulfobacterium sp.]
MLANKIREKQNIRNDNVAGLICLDKVESCFIASMLGIIYYPPA